MTFTPLIIIGAGRSGTNILRDTLTKLDGFQTWDCDEINLIWRHGNISKKDDIFGPQDARPEVRRYLHAEFEKMKHSNGAETIVEKTCANSLRVPFIDAVFPDARYVYIVRDGRDVALSAAKRWTASVEAKYLFKKLRFVPISDVPHYGFRFLKNRLYQARSQEKRQASWGPIFPDMPSWVSEKPLLEVCAQQWAVCVNESDSAFSEMPDEKVFKVNYEQLVSAPAKTMNELANWWSPAMVNAFDNGAFDDIHDGSVDGWKRKSDLLTPEVMDILSPVLERHGYEATA